TSPADRETQARRWQISLWLAPSWLFDTITIEAGQHMRQFVLFRVEQDAVVAWIGRKGVRSAIVTNEHERGSRSHRNGSAIVIQAGRRDGQLEACRPVESIR